LELHPLYTIAWVLSGQALLLRGDLVAALDRFESALRLEPANGSAASGLQTVAAQSRERGRPDVAVRAHAALARAQPLNSEHRQAWAEQLAAAGDVGGALAVLRALAQTDPSNYRIHNAIGKILGNQMNDQAGALAAFERAAALTDTEAVVWENLGVAYGQAGRHREAVVALEKSLRIDPGNPRAAGRLGDALRAAKEPGRARERLDRRPAPTERSP
jgi:Flp pilus assembly protein TadD